MRNKSTLLLFLLIASHICYGGTMKKQLKKTTKQATEQKKIVVEDEYLPNKEITFNPNALAILDDKVVSFGYVSDYCYEKKLGEFFRMLTPKEGVFYYGEKGRYGVILAKTIK